MLEVSVEVDGEAAEAVCELFERYGGGAVVEVQVRDTDSGRSLPERRHRVLTYLPVDDVEARFKVEVGLWHLSLLHPIPEANIRSLAEANWAEAWKAHYRPLRIPATLGLAGQTGDGAAAGGTTAGGTTGGGSVMDAAGAGSSLDAAADGQAGSKPAAVAGFVILPSWLSPDSMEPPPGPDEVLIRLDPGMAFGTGLHPSTQLCLAALARRLRPGDDVLDLGTGSGILAIGARLLDAGRVLGVDIDPKAVEVAGANAAMNGCLLELLSGELAPEGLKPIAPGGMRAAAAAPAAAIGGPFQLLLANILAPTLIVLAPTLEAHLAPAGLMVLSGILAEQAADVTAAYEAAGLVLREQAQEGDWVALTLGRRR